METRQSDLTPEHFKPLDGTKELRFHPYLLWFPTMILCLIMICFSLFGDGLRDALDPRMRK